MEMLAFSLRDYFLCNFKEVLGLQFYENSQNNHLGCLTLWGIIEQVTCGLEFIHFKRQFHRDIKPENSCLFLLQKH